jgi:hypothetical protein
MTAETKERLFKDGLAQTVTEIIEELNKLYPDVSFSFEWTRGMPPLSFGDYKGRHVVGGYNAETQSDEGGYHEDYEYDDENTLYESSLEELGMKLIYTWTRKCDLGHFHKTKRFHLFSMPKIFGFKAEFMITKKVDGFVKAHIPDFFY